MLKRCRFIPESWIRKCFNHLDSNPSDAKIINIYASDVIWDKLLDQVNEAILRCPPTNTDFVVSGGIRFDPIFNISDVITFDTPK